MSRKSSSVCSKFVAAQEAVIDENVGEPVANGAVDQRRGDSGIHAAAQRADGAGAFGLAADRFDRGGDESGAVPVLLCAADIEHKVAEDFRAAVGVIHLGMELHAVEFFCGIFERGYGVIGAAR